MSLNQEPEGAGASSKNAPRDFALRLETTRRDGTNYRTWLDADVIGGGADWDELADIETARIVLCADGVACDHGCDIDVDDFRRLSDDDLVNVLKWVSHPDATFR